MEPESDSVLEGRIAEELRLLPPLAAPRTLIPRVLAILEARDALPWWRQSWWTWPVAAKAAFVVLAIALFSLLSRSGPVWSEGVNTASQQLNQGFALVSSLWETLSVPGNAMALVLGDGAYWLLWAVLGGGLATYLLCMGLGTLFVRVALKPS